MKKLKLFSAMFFIISAQLFAQGFSDIVHVNPNYQPAKNLNGVMTLTQETIKEVVIIAMDPGSGCVLPDWFNDLFNTHLPSYFSQSTHANFIYQPTVLKRDATHAYEMLTVPSQHSHGTNNMQYVLQTADATVNFALYDWNNDGIVELHFTSIGPGNWGVAYVGGGYSYEYITNDQGSNGLIKVRVNHESRGINRDNYYGVIVHEDGHFYFGFDDQEHEYPTTFNHWGLGSFDAMSHILGFYDDQRVFTQPSPYNPTYSAVKGWISPTNITGDLNNFTLQDYQFSKALYCYTPPNLPSNAIPNQKLYITYIVPNRSYVFKNFPTVDKEKGGILIWHTKGDGLLNGGDFTNWYSKDIDIEAAHGKTNWTDDQYDTGIQNPISGRDKLEVRKVVNNQIVGGPYYGQVEVGDSSIFYLPGDGKSFTFYSNPNSNWYNQNETYAHNIASGFVFKNFQYNTGIAKADFNINNYIIDVNTTLPKGTWYFNSDLTINNGVTFNIQAGSILRFASGKKIIVNGILNTWGTATENVTFDRIGATGSWGGIVYNSGSSGTLNWSIITNVQTYGGAAIVINGSSPTIQNCTIENNVGATSGIQVLSNGQPYIYNNIIRNNPEHGIYISHSNPYLRYNMITGSTSANKASVYCYNFASPLFGGVGGGLSEGKNTLQSGYYGIVADYYSTPSAGASDIAYNNRFINNSCANAYANYYSTIYARYDWWGSSTPDPNKIISVNGSTIYWDPSLTSDPGPSRSMLSTPYSNNETLPTGLSFSINNSGSPNNTEIQQSVVFDDLLKARELRFTKNYNEAFNIYKSILSSKKEMSEAKIALVELGNIYAETKDLKILTFIKGFIQTKYDFNGLKPIAMEALSKIYTSENNINEAIEINTQLINDYNGTIHERSGGMNLFFIYYNSGKFDLSKEMLSSVKTKFENNTEMEAAEWLLYVAGVYDAKSDLSKVITINQNQELIKNSTDYQLFDNYPNPFNPTTKISYHLPEASFVTLKVYDILGREIVTLVNEAKPSGKHEVEFDASKLPSGTYIYQLTAGNNQIIRKMLLIK